MNRVSFLHKLNVTAICPAPYCPVFLAFLLLVTLCLGLISGCGVDSGLFTAIPPAVFIPLVETAERAPEAGTWQCFQGDPLHRGWRQMKALPKMFEPAWTFKLQNLVFEYLEGVTVFSRNAVFVPRDTGGLVIFGSYDRNIYALDLESGRRMWDRSTGGPVTATPVLSADGNRVFVASGDRSVYCLNADDGEVIWKHETMPWSYTSFASQSGDLTVYQRDGIEYLLVPMYNADRKAIRNYRDASLFLYRSDNGTLVKQIHLDDSPVTGVMVLPDGPAPVGIGAMSSGTVYAINLSTGEFYWKRVMAGRMGGAPVLTRIDGKWLLLLGDAFGAVWALSPDDGSIVWNNKTGLYVHATAAVHPPTKRAVVPSEDRHIHVFDLLNGERKGTFKTGKYVNSSPVVLAGGGRTTILAASMDEHLYWIDADSFKQIQSFKMSPLRWKYEKRSIATWSSPTVIKRGETVYLLYGDMGGTFHCFTGTAGQ